MSSPVQKTRIALALACISIIAFIAWKLPTTPADKAEATATAAAEAPRRIPRSSAMRPRLP